MINLIGCNVDPSFSSSTDNTDSSNSQNKSIEELKYQYDSETETVTILSFGNTVDYDQTDAYEKIQEITHPTNIVISEGITSIPDYFFSYSIEGASGKERNHFNQIKNVKIPNTVIKIGDSAFSYCYGLEAVSIRDRNSL